MSIELEQAPPRLHGVILAGGVGTRFWPYSRSNCPKQFLKVSGERSLIQSAFDLTHPWIAADRKWVVTNHQYADQTAEHLPLVSAEQILQEPCGRNTAPAIGLAALCIQARDPEAVMLVMPADHVISPAETFRRNVQQGLQQIEQNPTQLILFGIPPADPATGFGYIERGAPVAPGLFPVKAFHEKPDRPTAERYLRDGRFFWNCGIFMWKAAEILRLLKQYEPEIAAALKELQPSIGQPDWNDQLQRVFPRMKSISIDYAVLERERSIAVIEAGFSWNDVGGWEALSRLHPVDSQGNLVLGQHTGIDTENCLICSSGDHLVGTIGLKNCLIVQTPQATLVARRNDEQGIRDLLVLIRERGFSRYL